ncbi:membrane protein insertase YidC [Campylobacter sp. VicNov18]|uniref:membrane protein insertase YidC n=1 Tax=Campylobacter bilis TaxID=2691918 RepID=UPI001325E5E7|nr:membrane protein insertase YidC [Campylobacter bilis]MPV63867.1 membrane protein insertase YidC [Campylobacter hepaticus]MBM0637368.1 membrane protein insertase YidC [Campylobacter bilis]MCC8278089.1 membrane protein insertase YidC [Campylobacter bilis]MCC8299593.1 membrane protein insertase YidC [Campylobacter bilis]MCC8300998.1 membrane protein insertase YidC [Campylobacter bilis]
MNQANNIFQQKRILLAVVISFLFFVVYDYFFIPKNPIKIEQNITQNSSKSLNLAPNATADISTTSIATKNIIANVKSKHFQAEIDSLGRIVNFYLKDKKYQNENGEFINLIPKQSSLYPLELRFSDFTLNQEAFNTAYQADKKELFVDDNTSQTLHLTQRLSQLVVEKTLVFYPQGNYEIKIKLSKDAHYFISPGYRPDIAIDSYTVHGALVMDNKESIHTYEDEKVDKDENIKNALLVSAFDRYYTTFFYNFEKPLNAIISKDEKENPLAFVSSTNEFHAGAYIGSKEHVILRVIDPRLEAVVEYGWFTFIAKPMFEFLNFLHQYIGNWGWAIVVMTLIVRIILFPLTYKSMISMNKLKDLAPKMKEIKERYKGEPQKMNMHMMELYKKHGANPMSGCLPILLQIPIFFAIYRVLLNAIELKAAPWAFWIHDLSIMDPYFILPILMGVTMFVQQLITPMTIQDPMQAKIMKFLPVIFTFFFITFPAGLTLYWFINNLCSLVQQWVINKMFAKEHHKKTNGVKK